jgi:hypothetical protein
MLTSPAEAVVPQQHRCDMTCSAPAGCYGIGAASRKPCASARDCGNDVQAAGAPVALRDDASSAPTAQEPEQDRRPMRGTAKAPSLACASAAPLPPNGRFCGPWHHTVREGSPLPRYKKDDRVKFRVLIATAFLAALAAPAATYAQGVPGGISHGVHEGNRRAGPVGAVVGGAVGGVIGGVEGVLGIDRQYYRQDGYAERPRRTYRHRKAVRRSARHAHRQYYRR